MPSVDGVDDAPAPLGRRERKKLETRDRIFECAVALFAARGYDATTMEDIGERADVARATVFNYFPRKDDIVFEWIARRRAMVSAILAEGGQQATDTATRLRRAFRSLAHVYEDDSTTGRAMVHAFLRAGGPLAAYTSETPVLLADAIRSGQERGDIRPEVDPTRAGLVLFDAYLGILYRWVDEEGGRATLEEELTATLELVLAGLAR